VRFSAIRAASLRSPWGSLVSGAPADAAGDHALEDITFQDVDLTCPGAGLPAGPHHFGSSPEEMARFPEYQGGYPDPKFLFATPGDKAEVTDYTLPGWAFFVRHARGIAFEDCRLRLEGPDGRLPVAKRQ